MKPPIFSEIKTEVPFHDVDVTLAVWHGHYYKYFELARTALLRSIGYDIPQMMESGYSWPVIETHCKYVAPLSYGLGIKVSCTLLEYQFRLKLGYLIRTAATGETMARGHTVQVAVSRENEQMCFASPAALLDRLRDR